MLRVGKKVAEIEKSCQKGRGGQREAYVKDDERGHKLGNSMMVLRWKVPFCSGGQSLGAK